MNNPKDDFIKEISDYPTEKFDCLYWFKRAKESEKVLKKTIWIVETTHKSDPADDLETEIVARIDPEGKTNNELAMIFTQYIFDYYNNKYRYTNMGALLSLLLSTLNKGFSTDNKLIYNELIDGIDDDNIDVDIDEDNIDNLIYLIYKYIKFQLCNNKKSLSFNNENVDDYDNIYIYKDSIIINEYGFDKLYNRRRHAIVAWCAKDCSGYNPLYWI